MVAQIEVILMTTLPEQLRRFTFLCSCHRPVVGQALCDRSELGRHKWPGLGGLLTLSHAPIGTHGSWPTYLIHKVGRYLKIHWLLRAVLRTGSCTVL